LDSVAAIDLLTDICVVIVANRHNEPTVDLDFVLSMDIVAIHARSSATSPRSSAAPATCGYLFH
jgi:hypothetical protein